MCVCVMFECMCVCFLGTAIIMSIEGMHSASSALVCAPSKRRGASETPPAQASSLSVSPIELFLSRACVFSVIWLSLWFRRWFRRRHPQHKQPKGHTSSRVNTKNPPVEMTVQAEKAPRASAGPRYALAGPRGLSASGTLWDLKTKLLRVLL